jgi:hypothetical protein
LIEVGLSPLAVLDQQIVSIQAPHTGHFRKCSASPADGPPTRLPVYLPRGTGFSIITPATPGQR